MNWLQQPFVQVALPIIITLVVAAWSQNRRIDELRKRVDDLRDSMNKRLEAIDQRLAHRESAH